MKILDRLPLLPQPRTLRFGQRHVPFLRDEIVVWLSVGLPGERDHQRLSPPFPALLDSGNNSAFYLHEHHLAQWAGIRPALLDVLVAKRVNQQNVPCLEADVWLHPNTPGTWERAPGRQPFRSEFGEGMAVGPRVPDQLVFPRVPLLGIAALRENGLDFWFDSKPAQCHVCTAG